MVKTTFAPTPRGTINSGQPLSFSCLPIINRCLWHGCLILALLYFLPAQANDQLFSGHYSYGFEVDAFTPCGQEVSYWVSHNRGSQAVGLEELYTEHTTKPYQFVYLKFLGHMRDEKSDGFAADYDGTVHVSEVLQMRLATPNDCSATEPTVTPPVDEPAKAKAKPKFSAACKDGGGSQIEAATCTQQLLTEADAELNRQYRALVAKSTATQRQALRNIQRAWIKMKDTQCNLIKSHYQEAGARFADNWRVECEATMTQQRVRDLTALSRTLFP